MRFPIEICCVVAVVSALSGCCTVSKAAHCKFVSDVANASANYPQAAQQAKNALWEAEATELSRTVHSQKLEYCK